MSAPVRSGNCSGFYGERLSAMRNMREDGELDYLTGDYSAEQLTKGSGEWLRPQHIDIPEELL